MAYGAKSEALGVNQEYSIGVLGTGADFPVQMFFGFTLRMDIKNWA